MTKSKLKKKDKTTEEPTPSQTNIGIEKPWQNRSRRSSIVNLWDFVDGRDDGAPVWRRRHDGDQVRAPLWRGRRDAEKVRATVWRGREDEQVRAPLIILLIVLCNDCCGDGGCCGDSNSRRLLVFDTGTTFSSQEMEAVMADAAELQEQSSIHVCCSFLFS